MRPVPLEHQMILNESLATVKVGEGKFDTEKADAVLKKFKKGKFQERERARAQAKDKGGPGGNKKINYKEKAINNQKN
jgi:superfamily II RNA helicase